MMGLAGDLKVLSKLFSVRRGVFLARVGDEALFLEFIMLDNQKAKEK